jgi:tetratricopeptide (TPR) repeat protein
MRTTSPKLDTAHLDKDDEAELRCRKALELKDRGEYEAARDALFPFWKGIGSRPNTNGLREDLVARVFLCAGIVAGWLGGKSEGDEVDDYTRDLITESIRLYEAAGRSNKVAEAQAELAQCYWRAGDNATARIWLTTALEELTSASAARANALLILSSVEWAESHYNEVLKILTLNATLFERSTNHTIRGAYHNQLGITFRAIGASKTGTNYFQRAKEQYEAADEELRLAKHAAFRAMVKNNLAFVLRELGQLDEAYECLEQARRLLMRVGDRVKIANVDDSRAQVLIAQKKYSLAEPIARSAARTFKKAGRQCFLAESLITQGIALARLYQPVRAEFIFREAIEIAYQAGSVNRAGLATLTMIEELDTLSRQLQSVAFEKAKEWLADSDSPDIKPRLKAAGKKLATRRQTEPDKAVDVYEVLFNKRHDLDAEVKKYEHDLISEALAKVGGKVSHAADLLNVNHQSLALTIETKHPDLLNERTPVIRKPRRRKKMSRPKYSSS